MWKPPRQPSFRMTYTPEEKYTLFQIARGAVASALQQRPFEFPDKLSDSLMRPSGVFVTLQLDDELRGCVGSVQPVEPLYQAVAHNALNAAFRDPRFPPLTREEFDRVVFEISVMTIPEPVGDLQSITVGRDGLIVRRGGLAGLLLPQVATDYRWDREQFLSYTCMKAGLPADAWRQPGCRVEKFTAEVFSEVSE